MDIDLILYLLACGMGLFFLGGIITAGILSIINACDRMPSFLTHSINLIGGVLATNLGAVLGIETVNKNLDSLFKITNIPPLEALQHGAAILYLGGMILAILFWAIKGFSGESDRVVPILSRLSLTLIGVGVGALTIMLGLSNS